MQSDVTIVTVAGPSDAPYLHANFALMERMMDHDNKHLVVIDNNKTASGSGLENLRNFGVEILDGVAQDTSLPIRYRASYQHAAALGQFIQTYRLKTRYVLIMDPDFYVITQNWIRRIQNHMTTHNLAFFGAPWHPQWYNKYRYFPCVHHLWIDTQAIDVATLDFTPDLTEPAITASALPSLLHPPLRPLARLTINRLAISQARDTGYRIHRQYHASPCHAAEILQPVALPNQKDRRWEHFFLPDRLCYQPKRPDYVASTNFSAHGLPDLRMLGWEEFLWQGAPFGFHLRRFGKGHHDIKTELAQLKNALEKIS